MFKRRVFFFLNGFCTGRNIFIGHKKGHHPVLGDVCRLVSAE